MFTNGNNFYGFICQFKIKFIPLQNKTKKYERN